MTRYRKVKSLDAATAAYLAGLIDGEGTVTLTRQHRNEGRRIVVCISNNELGILEFAKECIGAGRIT
ncbi:MAG TPA: LAGLIDADG family homing endonuclease, partial [Burkholderiales bacterium]|nr:LAGLIDADG family homing endonuclease [Burkholderiales bacterium]